MQITLTIKNTDNTGKLSQDQLNTIQEVMTALISSGSLTGVRGGKTIIHFDGEAKFMGISTDYMVWRKRKN
jgi:hypothetical protein